MFNVAKYTSITIDKAHFTFNNVNWLHVGSREFSTSLILNMNVINALYSGLNTLANYEKLKEDGKA
jgi:hypothetical protein